jgi:hypothetical protein
MKISSLAWKALSFLVVFSGILTLGCLLFWQVLTLDNDPITGSVVWLVVGTLTILGIFWASIIAHELGHLLAALAGGMRIFLVIFGPLKFVREGGRFRLRINWRSTTPGCVLAIPTEIRNLRGRMLLYIGAGPFASLLLGSLLLFIALHWNAPSMPSPPPGVISPTRFLWMPQSHAIAWISFGAVLNLMLFVQNLIPDTVGGFTTDGGHLLALLRGSLPAERQILLHSLAAISHNGVRPREWERALIERLLASCDGSATDVSANLYEYYHNLDCGRIEEADRRLEQAVALRQVYMAEFRPAILLESAYFLAFHRHDASAARTALDLAEGGIVEAQTRLRAEAAVLLAEGHCEEAGAKAEAGLKLVSRSIDRGGAIAEEEWLSAIRAECLERMGKAEAVLSASCPRPSPD